MRTSTYAIITLMLLGGCDNPLKPDDIADAGDRINGSGNLASATRAVTGFDAVTVSGVGKLEIEQTGTESLTITAEDNILPLLTSEVTDGHLVLGPPANVNLRLQHEVVYRLTVRDLRSLAISGVMEVDAVDLQTESLDVTMSGVSTARMAGVADRQNLVVSGPPVRYLAEALRSRFVSLDVSDVAQVVVNVSDRLEGTVSRAATVEYIGNPTVTVSVSGGGSVVPQ